MPYGVLYAFVTSHERGCDGDARVGEGCDGCEVTVHEVRVRYPAPEGRDSPAALAGARRAVLREVRRRLAASDPP